MKNLIKVVFKEQTSATVNSDFAYLLFKHLEDKIDSIYDVYDDAQVFDQFVIEWDGQYYECELGFDAGDDDNELIEGVIEWKADDKFNIIVFDYYID